MKRRTSVALALIAISLDLITACDQDGSFTIDPVPLDQLSDDIFPAWSPDGTTIAFEHNRVASDTCCGPFGIYFVNADVSGRRLFLAGAHSPAWSPDGEKLAFVLGGSIAMMNKDGTGFRSFNVEGFFPAWSPDGTKIAYDTSEGGSTFFIDLTNNGDYRIQKFLDNAFSPDWSPNGKEMVFSRYETPFSQHTIYKARLDGSGIQKLTHTRGENNGHYTPAYSNSGDKIAFSSQGRGLTIMDVDGNNQRIIISTSPNSLILGPSWSSDDQYLVFGGLTDAVGRGRLFIIKPDGTGLRQLTF